MSRDSGPPPRLTNRPHTSDDSHECAILNLEKSDPPTQEPRRTSSTASSSSSSSNSNRAPPSGGQNWTLMYLVSSRPATCQRAIVDAGDTTPTTRSIIGAYRSVAPNQTKGARVRTLGIRSPELTKVGITRHASVFRSSSSALHRAKVFDIRLRLCVAPRNPIARRRPRRLGPSSIICYRPPVMLMVGRQAGSWRHCSDMID